LNVREQAGTLKFQIMKLKFKIWIENENNISILGEGKWKLLQAIKETGSLKAAAEEMGFAYRQTWENLKTIEEKLGFQLVEKTRGGESGGKTILTPKGEQIVEFFENLYQEIEPMMQAKFNKMIQKLNDITH
jgi:molybdate transport system regulatory protein